MNPIIQETSNQARILMPMVIVLGFCLFFATNIVLMVVAGAYLASQDSKARVFGFLSPTGFATLDEYSNTKKSSTQRLVPSGLA